MEWPTSKVHDNRERDYGRTFTSASLREQNRFDGRNARSEAVDTLFSDDGRER